MGGVSVEPLVAAPGPEPHQAEPVRTAVEVACLRTLPAWIQTTYADSPEWVTDRDDVDEILAERIADALLSSAAADGDPPQSPQSPPESPHPAVPDDSAVPDAFRPRGGRPLPGPVQRWAEARTGRDLGSVRVHDSPRDQARADALDATAYTSGRDIVLGSGVGTAEQAYATVQGRHVLAHELGHVIAPPRNGRVGRGEPDAPVDKSVRWSLYQPPADVEKVLGEVPAYLHNLAGITWDQTVLDQIGADEVANGTHQRILEPVLVTIVCDNYVIILDRGGGVVSVESQETAKVPPGGTRGIALSYPALGLVWSLGEQTRAADGSTAIRLQPTATRTPLVDAEPGRSFLTVYLPGASASKELIERLTKAKDKAAKPKVNTSDTPGWTKDQLAKLKKVKAQKSAQQTAPQTEPQPAQQTEPPAGSKDGSETGQGKGDTGEGKGAGHGTGDGVGDGTEPGESGGGQGEKTEDPLKGPVKYSTWQGAKGPPQLVIEVDLAWTSIPLKEGETTDDLEARADAALAALQASRDPANSTVIEKGATQTGFAPPKDSTEGVAQTKAQAEEQAASTATHQTPGEMATPGKGGIANAPAYPSKLAMSGRDERFPAVTTSGATNEFSMVLDYAALSYGFQDEVFNRLQTIQFYWEVIDVTGLTVAKAKEMSKGEDERRQKEAEDLAAKTAIGAGTKETGLGAMGTTFTRDLNAIAEDQANDIAMMAEEDWPWEARAAYLGVIGISNVIRSIGSIVGSFIDVLTQPLNARSIGFDHNGDYIVRCVATPVVSDKAREDPDHHVIRTSSIAVLPIRVSNVNDRAVEGLGREDETIAAKEQALAEAKAADEPSESAIENAKAEVDALLAAKARSATDEMTFRIEYLRTQVRLAESIERHRTSPPPAPKPGEKPERYPGWSNEEVALAIRLLGMGKLVHVYRKEMHDALEQMTKSGHESWVKQHTTFEPVGEGKKTQFRPRMVLASEVNGQVTDVLVALGQVSKGDSGPWKWKLVDITSPGSRDEYIGTSSKAGEAGRVEAIRNCFRKFAETSGYGRGTLAIRLPDDLRSAVPTVQVEATMRSAPGGADRGLARLGDLAKAAMVAGMFVTGPAGMVIGVVGGVSGAIIAANSLVKRARTGHLLEIGTVFDVLGVIGGAVSVLNTGVSLVRGSAEWSKKLAGAPQWMSRLEKVEKSLHIYGKIDNVQQIISIPVQLAVEWHEIEQSGGSEGEKRSRKMKALLHALETGVITVVMMGGGIGSKEGPGAKRPTDSEAPLPKGSGEADAHARADGQGPAKPPTVRPDEPAGGGASEDSAPARKPITVDDAKALAKERLEATAQAERNAAKGDEKVAPDGEERTTTGTPKVPSSKTQPEPPLETKNAAEKQKVVEILSGRLAAEAPHTTTGAKAPQGEYGARTTNSQKAVETYDQAVADSAGREVGLFFNPNTGEFQVTVGTENSVRGPRGDGWQALVHLHPNPENVITFRLPAPADVWGAIKAALRTGSHTEFVQSTRPDGRLGLSKLTVTTPPLKITVELPASPGEPARTIEVTTPDAYVAEYARDATYLEPGSRLYEWVMKDLDDYYDAKRKDADERTAGGVAGKPSNAEAGVVEPKVEHAQEVETLQQQLRELRKAAPESDRVLYDSVQADLNDVASQVKENKVHSDELPADLASRLEEIRSQLEQYRTTFAPVPVAKIESKAQRMRTEASKSTKKGMKAALDDLATRFDRLAAKAKKNPKFDPRLEYAGLVSEWAGLRVREGEVVFDLRDAVLRKDTVDWFKANSGQLATDQIGQLVLKRLISHLETADFLMLGQSPRSANQGKDLETNLQGAVKAAVKAGSFPDWYLAEFEKAVAVGEKHGRTDGWPTDDLGVAWQVDHVVELWMGGADDVTNFLAIPVRTHTDKNAMMGTFRRDFRGRAVEGESVDARDLEPK